MLPGQTAPRQTVRSPSSPGGVLRSRLAAVRVGPPPATSTEAGIRQRRLGTLTALGNENRFVASRVRATHGLPAPGYS